MYGLINQKWYFYASLNSLSTNCRAAQRSREDACKSSVWRQWQLCIPCISCWSWRRRNGGRSKSL